MRNVTLFTFVAIAIIAAWCGVLPAQYPHRPPTPGGRIVRPQTDTAEANPYTAKPTLALLKGLKLRLAESTPTSTQSKLSRIELAARIFQCDLALGDKGSREFDQLAIRPEQAQAALEALAAVPQKKLNNLGAPEIRKIIWDALGSSHPLYRLYSEGARLAKHRDDELVLDRVLRHLKDAWSQGDASKRQSDSLDVIDPWMLGVLVEALRLQSIESIPDAAAYLQDFPAGPEPPRPQPLDPNDPPARVTRGFFRLRAGGSLGEFDRLAHLGAALQRAGFDVSFWCLAVFQPVDETTKTLVHAPLLVFPEQADELPQMAIGPEWLLDSYEGDYFGDGLYRFPTDETLAPLLIRRGLFRVALADVLEPAASLAVWSEALQKSLSKVKGEFSYRQGLFEQSLADPWAEFARLANQSLSEVPRSRFADQMRRNKATLSIGHLNSEGKPEVKNVANLDERDAKDVLPKHEAVAGRAFQALPIKMPPLVQTVTLQSARAKEMVDVAVLKKGGQLVVEKAERLQGGRGWAKRIMLALPSYGVAVHETLHAWSMARGERFDVEGWRGGLLDLFNEISWDRSAGTKWELRSADNFKLDDFLSEYGATNVNEDLAVTGQFYVVFPKLMRDKARLQLQEGNFVLAVKYLYLKYVAFLDEDELSAEYGLDGVETPFTIDEFERRVRALEKSGGLSEEQQRLLELARLIYALSLQMRETKRIL